MGQSDTPVPAAKRNYKKRLFPGRPDGGPTTRSRVVEPIQATQPTVSDKILDQRMTKAKMSFEAIQQLNLEQWASLKSSIDKETQLWKNCVIQRDWGPGQVGPDFECDDYGLPI